ncbi:MAG: hypothetical protein ABIR55_14905 [Burkholderiaceae bacterium]
MEILVIAIMVAIAPLVVRRQQDRQRIALLAHYLQPFQIEKLMATLSDGYQRALGESDPQRQQQVWDHLRPTEQALCEQFDRLALRIASADAQRSRVSTLAWALPWAQQLFPAASFDLRKAIAIHAHGIRRAAEADPSLPAKRRAYALSAEMFLMQHTCHWFCKSKAVASARLWVRHHTRYEQLFDAVTPATARAYRALVGLPGA